MICKEPSCVNEFTHWYRADRLDLGDVTTWEDQVGEADFTNDTSGWVTNEGNQINGLPAVLFDTTAVVGNPDFTASTSMFSGRKRFTVSMVIEKPVLATNLLLAYGVYNADYSWYLTSGTDVLTAVMTSSLPAPIGEFASDANYFTGTDWSRLHVVYEGIYGTNAGKFRVFRDGTDQALVFTGTFPGSLSTITTQTMRIGRLTGLGVGTNIGCRIAEIIISSKASFSVMEEIDDYFSLKYNL